MERKSVIVIITSSDIEVWGNLKLACFHKNWSYSTISKQKLPIQKDGYEIHRCEFKCGSSKLK